MAIRLLALTCLVGAALAGPLQKDDDSQCSTSCPSLSEEKFQYRTGSRYVYKYKGIDYISVAGNRKEMKSQITANVEIHVLDRCEMVLKISDFNYHGEQPLSSNIEEELSTPLRFSWVDGKIENICSSSDESQESENIKRGILSAIVNTMPDLRSPARHREVDSLGSCETKYTVVRNDADSVTIKKEKSLKSCDNRHSGLTAFPYNSYQSPQSQIQGLPIFTHEKLQCQQDIQNQVIQRATCTASAQIQPLSQYDSLVQFKGEVHLELQTVQRSSSSMISQAFGQQNSQMEKKGIRYNYDQQQDVASKEREATEILTELCSKTEGLLHPSVSKFYMRLITVLKGLPAESVQSLYQSLKSQQLCHSPKTLDIFLDALPMAGTEGSIKLMVELLRTKQISGLKAKIWPASFALIPSPNAETISAVLPLVSGEEKSRPVLLGLSAMIYKICSTNDCDQIESVQHAVSALQQGLGSQCSSENEEEVISILKAFGNMGYHGQAEQTILACARSSEKSVPLRLAAVEAFRRYIKEIPASIIELYSSPNENFEIRIAALTTAVACEDSRVSSAVQSVLGSDQDEQVVAYTLSLVKNLQETSSPLKQSIKQSLQHISTNQSVGYWENSKNIEFSAFNVPTNLGASLESNIIHTQGTKIPRSFSSKIDIDIFGKNVNIFEFGTRAEGLEKAARKFFGMEESNKQKRSWLSLTSRMSEEEKPEISFYARTFGTEFFDMTVSDFTSLSNMMQFADVVNKISQSKTVDFSHSFLFLNTKVIIPSVTGRSYAFGMTGSATVGLSANGKFDIINLMSSPRNGNIGGHIQPSANVEITTTLGVHSEKSRPDIKIVTSFHSETDVGAKLLVKDSHMAEARLDLPSEKVQLLKVSTELFEVDANDNETPIIEEMQTKIDHCISTLEKPLGIQFCAKLETPRPFVSRNFPYARGLGNLELAFNKADRSLTGYVILLEMPKRQADHMSYRFTMDTPGSSVNRKFHAQFDLEKTPSGEREFKLNAQCPFKDVLASGSYAWRSDLVKGALNVITDKSHRYSVNGVVEMSMSSSEMTFKPTLQWSLPASKPVSVSGSMVYSRQRKQQLTIDIRSDQAGERPYVFTGNFMKDGSLGVSQQDQWKMSADLFTKTPFITTKIHSTADKQSGQTQSIASSLSVDYETQSIKKHSVKLFSKLQQSSSKISASAQLESTQFPRANCALNWEMQGSPKDSFKNDITLGYGENHEATYVQISQIFQRRNQNSLSECKISLQVPQFSIDSELKTTVGLNMQDTGTFHIESDLRYKQQRHAKFLVQLRQLSKAPVKMAIKAQLEYPGRKLMYKDEIQEISANVFQGRSVFQWQSNRQASLRYKYKQLGDDSTFHHEFESTFNAPFLQSQIMNQASLKATKESFEIRAQIQNSRQLSYKLDAQLKKRGQSHVSISSPVVEGEIEVSNEPQKKSGTINFVLKQRGPQRFAASASLDLSAQKSVQTAISWRTDANPSQKVSFAAQIDESSQRSQKSFRVSSKVQVLDYVTIDASCSCKKGQQTSLQSSIDVSGRNFERFSINAQSEMTKETVRSTISYRKGQSDKAVVELSGKYAKQSRGLEMQTTFSIKSPDHSFEDKVFSIQHSFDKTRSSTSLQCSVNFENAPGKKHQVTLEFLGEAELSKKLRISMVTPYQQFSKQEISVSHKKEDDKHTVDAVIQYSTKKITLSSVLSRSRQGGSISCSLTTPYKMFERATMFAAFENQKSLKQVESQFELNGQKKFEHTASYISEYGHQKVQSSAKLFLKSELAMNLKAEKDQSSLNHEFSVTKDSSRLMSYRIYQSASRDGFTYQIDVQSSKDTLLDVKFAKKGDGLATYTLEAKKPFTPILVSFQSRKTDENSRNIIISACRESSERLCYALKSYYKRENGDQSNIKQRKITLDVEKITGQEPAELLCNIQYQLSQQDRTIKSSFLFEVKQKKYGYDLTIKQRSNEERPCELDVHFILPSRTVQCSLSAIHNAQRSAYELVVIPSTSSPDHKMSVEANRNWNSRENELSGQFKLSHPALEKPIYAKYSFSKGQSRSVMVGKFEVDYSKNPEHKLILELSSQSPRNQPEKNSFQCRLYTQGKQLDLTLRASMHQTAHKDSYACDWSWQSQQGKRSGKFSVQLSDKRSGRPQTAQIEVTCQQSQFAILGHTEWAASLLPTKAELQFSSNSRAIGAISYEQSDSCAVIDIQSSKPLLKNRVCMNKSEQQKITLFRVEFTCQDIKCLDVSLDLDPAQSHVANIGIMWKKEQFKQMLQALKDFKPTAKVQHFSKIKQELQQKAELIVSPLKEQVLQPLFAHMMEEVRQFSKEQAQEIEQLQKCLKNIAQLLPTMPTRQQLKTVLEEFYQWFRQEGLQYFAKHAPEWLYDLAKSLFQAAERYFHDLCQRGTFCYKVKQTYERRGMQHVQQLLKAEFHQRIEKLQKAKNQKLSSVRNWITESWNKVMDWAKKCKDDISSIIPSLKKSALVEKMTESYRRMSEIFQKKGQEYFEKLMKYVDRLMEHANKNNDFKVLASLLQELKDEILNVYQKFNLKKIMTPLRHTVMQEYPERWLRQQINVSQFDIRSGKVQVQVHHPFDHSKTQMLRNAFVMIKKKFHSAQK